MPELIYSCGLCEQPSKRTKLTCNVPKATMHKINYKIASCAVK